jgi:hypothetical protein
MSSRTPELSTRYWRRHTLRRMADTFVLFADMLGFAALVEAAPEAIDSLTPTFAPHEPMTLLYRGTGDTGPPPAELLKRRFAGFHSILEDHVRRFMGDGIASVVFSDSAFIQLDSVSNLGVLAGSLMRSLLAEGVPVRMGMACGTFRALRFSYDNTPLSRMHASQFLGTGVVRAHAAEQSGVQAMKILLHPSVVPHVSEVTFGDWVLKTLPIDPATSTASHELNYVTPRYDSSAQKIITDVTAITRSVEKMMRTASPDKRGYYQNTLAALARMHDQWTGT